MRSLTLSRRRSISIISTTLRTRTAGPAWCDSNRSPLRTLKPYSGRTLKRRHCRDKRGTRTGLAHKASCVPALPSSTCSRLFSLAAEFPREPWCLAWRRSREAHCQVGSPSPVGKNTMPAPFEPPTFRRHSRGSLSDHSAGPAWCDAQRPHVGPGIISW